jgi:hypothetical protein
MPAARMGSRKLAFLSIGLWLMASWLLHDLVKSWRVAHPYRTAGLAYTFKVATHKRKIVRLPIPTSQQRARIICRKIEPYRGKRVIRTEKSVPPLIVGWLSVVGVCRG